MRSLSFTHPLPLVIQSHVHTHTHIMTHTHTHTHHHHHHLPRYNQAAAMLREAWVKSRGAMANLNMSAHVAAQGMPGSLGGPSNTSIMYTEEWKVKSIEYRGWGVDKNAPALAGKHDVQVSLRREHAACW